MTFFEKNFNKMRNTAPAKNEISEIRNTESVKINFPKMRNTDSAISYSLPKMKFRKYVIPSLQE